MELGYFDKERNEYVITEMFPRRPLINYLWSDTVFCALEHFGGGTVSARINTEKRVFIGGDEARVGLGYHKVISEYKGIRTEQTIIIPKDGYAQMNNIKVTNLTDKAREIDLYSYIQLCLP